MKLFFIIASSILVSLGINEAIIATGFSVADFERGKATAGLTVVWCIALHVLLNQKPSGA